MWYVLSHFSRIKSQFLLVVLYIVGYYLATLEAAVQHILQLADDDAMMKRSKSEKNMNGSSSSSLAQQSNEHHC